MNEKKNPFVLTMMLSGKIKLFCAAIVVVLILVLVICLFGGRDSSKNVVATSKTVDFGLKNIGEFVTQAGYYTNVQVLEDSKKILGHNVPLTTTKCIFSYDGIIKAGMDFSALEFEVDEEKHTVNIKMPETFITSNEVDQNSLEIYDERQSIFTPLGIEDMNLSITGLKNEAEENAKEQGILETARANAELLIKAFLAGQYDPAVYEYVFQ